jgi:hypothetical protein
MKTIKMSSRINSANFDVLNLDQMVQLVGGEDYVENANPPSTGGGTIYPDPIIVIRK